ncbi:MAG: hypothetical protein ACYSW1_09855 [Planctomycetota bacterium]
MTHSNQEDHQVAHSNQETTVGQSVLLAGGPPTPAEPSAAVETGAGFGLRDASRLWVDGSIPPDAGEVGSAHTVIGLRADETPGRGLDRGRIGPSAGLSERGSVPAPSGLGLLAVAAVAGRGRRRRRASGA